MFALVQGQKWAMKKTRQEALIQVQVSPVSVVRRVERSSLGPETIALKAGLHSPSPGLAPAAAGRNVRCQRQGGHQAALGSGEGRKRDLQSQQSWGSQGDD